MNVALDIQGMDRLFNDENMAPLKYEQSHPNDSVTLSAYLRKMNFNALIVAWLVRNPEFETIAAIYQNYTKGRVSMTTEELNKLLTYLKEHVKPLVPSSS
jgi:hypothetical protein